MQLKNYQQKSLPSKQDKLKLELYQHLFRPWKKEQQMK